jgi:hypothetical protein
VQNREGMRSTGGDRELRLPEMACGGWGRIERGLEERKGGRSPTLALCEWEGLGGVTQPKYWPLFAPLVTCSVPINYLPINRTGQLMRRIGGICISHPPISD